MLDQLRNTYGGKKVFLTGHTGFKGAWLTLILSEIGAISKGFALEAETQSLYKDLNGDTLIESQIGDIRSHEELTNSIVSFQPDFIFHFAAQSLVRLSYDTPVETFETNVMGTVNLLDAVRQLEKDCKVIVITTDKVYENQESGQAYKEADKLGGYDPYSSSKAAAEIATASFRSAFFNPADYDQHKKSIATARAGNVIGGGDWAADRIIPDLVRSIQNDEPLQVRNPKAIRPWQHVLEPLSGYLLIGAKMAEDPVKYAEGFNFGPELEDEMNVEGLVRIAMEILGGGIYKKPDLVGQPHEANLLHLDISKAKKMLDWKPKLTAPEAIRMTMEWYKNASSDPLAYTKEQIESYFGDQ